MWLEKSRTLQTSDHNWVSGTQKHKKLSRLTAKGRPTLSEDRAPAQRSAQAGERPLQTFPPTGLHPEPRGVM